MAIGSYAPGSTVTVADMTWRVRGRIDVTAPDDGWSEYFLESVLGLQSLTWGLVEMVNGEHTWSLWHRRPATEARFNPHHEALDSALIEVDRGHARFQTHGDAGSLGIPTAGTMSYMAFTRPGQRISMQRFHHAGPWLVDTCDL